MSESNIKYRVGIDINRDGYVNWKYRNVLPGTLVYQENLFHGSPNLMATSGIVDITGSGSYSDVVVHQYLTSDATVPIDFESARSAKVVSLLSGRTFCWGRAANNKTTTISSQVQIFTRYGGFWLRTSSAYLSTDYSLQMRVYTNTNVAGYLPYSVTTKALPANTWVQITWDTGSAPSGYMEMRLTANTNMANVEIVGMFSGFAPMGSNWVQFDSRDPYEDITDLVKTLQFSRGAHDIKDRLPSAGKLTVTFTDKARDYRPWIASKTFGAALITDIGQKIIVQMFVGTSWKTMWTGFVTNINPVVDDVSNETVQIMADAPLYQVKNGKATTTKLAASPGSTVPISSAIFDLFRRNAIGSQDYDRSWHLNRSKLGVNTALNSAASGLFTNVVSEAAGWGYNTIDRSFDELLQGIMDTLPATYMIQRRSGAVLVNSYDPANGTVTDINLNTLAAQAKFSFGDNFYNHIVMSASILDYKNVLLLPDRKDAPADVEDQDEDDPAWVDRYWGKKKNIPNGGMKRWRRDIKKVATYNDDIDTHNYENWGLGNPPNGATEYDYDPDKVFIDIFRQPDYSSSDPDNANHTILWEATTPGGTYTRSTHALEFSWRRPDHPNSLRVRIWNDGSQPDTWSVDLYAVKALAAIIPDPVQYEGTIQPVYKLVTYTIPYIPFIDSDTVNAIIPGWLDAFANSMLTTVESFTFHLNSTLDPLFSLINPVQIGDVIGIKSSLLFMIGNTPSTLKHLIVGETFNIQGADTTVTYDVRFLPDSTGDVVVK